jgi:hypothetical protein
MTVQAGRRWQLLYVLPVLLYVGYVGFVIGNGRAGVDYETFMEIGARFNSGAPIWTENSYYPLPYVMIFGLFSSLPRPLSILIWHLVPVLAAILLSRWHFYPLLFAPLFAHMVGGQTAVFAMIGLALYRADRMGWRGGVGLALLLLKPQLGIFPLLWAGGEWLYTLIQQRRVPVSAYIFAACALLLYLPTFLLIPDWVNQWLAQPRPFFERALAGFVPRTLYLVFEQGSLAFWIALTLTGALLLFVIMRVMRQRLSFDAFMLAGFVLNPFVHDYDLIQMIPLLSLPPLHWTAILASVPTWLVIAFAYGQDSAWYVVTLIAPAVLFAYLWAARFYAPPRPPKRLRRH